MNISPQFQKRFNGLSKSFGFTLTELILAAAITGSAVALGGVGLTAIISSSTAINAGNERQDELSRAMDFISAEIREAKTINDASIDPSVLIAPNADVKTGTIEPIVWLDMANTDDDVFYYLAEPADSNSPWKGEKVLYRWGPEFDEDGEYKPSGTLSHSVLLDSLRNETNSADITCPSSWQKFPNTGTNIGFYACVEPDNKVASLFQVGQVDLVLEKSKPMLKARQTYSRASEFFSSGGGGGGTPPGENPIQPDPNRYVVTVDLDEFRLSHMGGAITCGRNGTQIPTQVTIIFETPDRVTSVEEVGIGGLVKRGIPRGTSISFRATRQAVSNCGAGEYTVDTRYDLGTQITALDNGDPIPYYDPFNNQARIDDFLADHLVDDRLAIDRNQKVFLFEVGERFSSNPGPAYDFQDIVLLADVIPSRSTKIKNNGGQEPVETPVQSSETVYDVTEPVETPVQSSETVYDVTEPVETPVQSSETVYN